MKRKRSLALCSWSFSSHRRWMGPVQYSPSPWSVFKLTCAAVSPHVLPPGEKTRGQLQVCGSRLSAVGIFPLIKSQPEPSQPVFKDVNIDFSLMCLFIMFTESKHLIFEHDCFGDWFKCVYLDLDWPYCGDYWLERCAIGEQTSSTDILKALLSD